MPITDTWIGGAGDWGTAANWSANAKPGTLDGAVFNSSADADLTNVEFENIASLQISSAAAAVDIQGELTIGGAHLNGVTSVIDVSAGSLTVDGGGLIAGQFVTEASGTVHVTNGGTYQWNGSGSTQNVDLGHSINDTFQFSTQFGGTISNFYSGDIISYSGAVNSVVVGENTVTFNATNGQAYVINFTGATYDAADLIVSGNTLQSTLLPPVTINGSFPTGYALNPQVWTLNIGAAAVIGGTGVTTTSAHPSTINNLGQIQATGTGITLPDGGTINNGSTVNHTALISGHTGITLKGAGTVTNFGTITGTGGTAISFNAAGARLIEEGSGVLNGAVVGGGGTLELGGKAGPGTLSGLGGNLLKGFATVTVDKASTWSLSGPSTIAAGTVLNNSGTLDLLGQLTNSGQVNNLSGATLALEGDFGIGNTGAFSNAGIFEKASGTGISLIRTGAASLTSSGTIDVESGTLELTGATIGITGAIKGAGTIEFMTGATTLGTGTALTVAGLTIAGTGAQVTVAHTLGYAGTFSAGSGTELTIGTGATFTLSGPASFFHDTVDGAGRLTTTGATAVNLVTLGGTAQWYNAGTLTETSTLTIGDSAGHKATFLNQATGVLNLAGNAGIAIGTAATSTFTNQGQVAKTGAGMGTIGMAVMNTGSLGSSSGTLALLGQVTNSGGGNVFDLAGATLALADNVSITTTSAGAFSNAGVFEKLAGTGTSVVRTGTASLTSSGTIDVVGGTLELTGATIGVSGKIMGAGTIEFGTGATTLATGSSLTVAGLTIAGTGAQVTVAHTLGYAGTFSAGSGTELTVAAGDTFTLSGPAGFLHDTVDGAGRLTTKGATTVNLVTLGGTAQWYNAGTLAETATLTIGDGIGDTATFVNQVAGVFDLAGNVGIGIGAASTSTFTNQGLLSKTAGGLSTIGIAVVNLGTLESASGTLDLQQAVTGPGGIWKIDAGKTIQADAAVSGQTVDFNGGGDKLILTDATQFAGKLQDFGAGDKLDLRQFVPGTTTLAYVENAGHTAGTLTVTDGALQAKIALLGDYTATAFHASPDGVAGGTFITYTPPPAPMILAAPHS